MIREAGKRRHPEEIQDLRTRVEEYLTKHGLKNRCNVKVYLESGWYTLKGRVNSYQTKSAIFRMVPRVNGTRRIVDRLRVKTMKPRPARQPRLEA